MLVETDQRRQLSLTTQDGKEKFMSCRPSISVDELLSGVCFRAHRLADEINELITCTAQSLLVGTSI
jgi:hypothetical protein